VSRQVAVFMAGLCGWALEHALVHRQAASNREGVEDRCTRRLQGLRSFSGHDADRNAPHRCHRKRAPQLNRRHLPPTGNAACNMVPGVVSRDNVLVAQPCRAQERINHTLMRTFVMRARAAPTDRQKLLASVGQDAHTEILAHTLMNAIFVAQSHRADVVVCLVLESTQDFSRTVRFEVNAMHEFNGFHEAALLGKVAKALDVSQGMGKEQSRPVESGVTVRTLSFERLMQELAEDHQLFLMDPKGTPIREQVFADNPCFVLTDHIPMPKKVIPSLERMGAQKITLGSKMLFASQCVVLIHHALDER
jgi:tRNA (pseudouridine54-N1)-methyltransferase